MSFVLVSEVKALYYILVYFLVSMLSRSKYKKNGINPEFFASHFRVNIEKKDVLV